MLFFYSPFMNQTSKEVTRDVRRQLGKCSRDKRKFHLMTTSGSLLSVLLSVKHLQTGRIAFIWPWIMTRTPFGGWQWIQRVFWETSDKIEMSWQIQTRKRIKVTHTHLRRDDRLVNQRNPFWENTQAIWCPLSSQKLPSIFLFGDSKKLALDPM